MKIPNAFCHREKATSSSCLPGSVEETGYKCIDLRRMRVIIRIMEAFISCWIVWEFYNCTYEITQSQFSRNLPSILASWVLGRWAVYVHGLYWWQRAGWIEAIGGPSMIDLFTIFHMVSIDIMHKCPINLCFMVSQQHGWQHRQRYHVLYATHYLSPLRPLKL